jgi:hypothetical protein
MITDIPTGWIMKGIGNMDNEAQVSGTVVCQPGTTYCNEAFRQGMDFADGSRIFVGGNQNMHIPGNCYDQTSYYLSVLDSGLQQQSYFTFGGDMYYQLNAVIASPNGGCMLAGMRSPDPDAGLTNAWLVILGPDMLMGTGPEWVSAPPVVISPNPGREMLQIRPGNNDTYEFMLFDVPGVCVLREAGHAGLTTISTNSLRAGLYIYRLVFSDGNIISGKWMKQ